MKLVKAAVVLTALMGSTAAMAAGLGASPEFGDVYTTVRTWIEGDIGGIIALLIFAVGMGMGIMKQSLGAIVIGLGGALAAANGADVIEGIMGAAAPVVDVTTATVQNLPTL